MRFLTCYFDDEYCDGMVWEFFRADGVLELQYFKSLSQSKCNEFFAILQTLVLEMHISVLSLRFFNVAIDDLNIWNITSILNKTQHPCTTVYRLRTSKRHR